MFDNGSGNDLLAKVAIYNFIFGTLVVIGGFLGFVLAESNVSLAAGLITGNLLMLSVWGTGHFLDKSAEKKIWGYILGALVSILLLGFFAYRLLDTGKPMPAVPVMVLSLVGIVINALVLKQRSNS